MKKRLCRWLYRHGFVRLAYKVSPSICGYLAGRDIAARLKLGLIKGRGQCK